uniref:Uncharacterized protein n=1 Tax=Caenorhabditis japonica TaxID=281687 RepID=A0A8R1HN24_CAEJA
MLLRFLFFILAITVPVILASPDDKLDVLFSKMMAKQDNVKKSRLIDFISRGAPAGVDAPMPTIAEYETFKSDKSVNFLSDGAGHVVFRQYRRIRISDLLGSQMKSRPGLQI